MPIFDYQCASCGHTFDALQKLADKALRDCPACGKRTLKKLVSAPALQAKGGTAHSHGGHSHTHGPGGHTHGPKCNH